MSLAELATMHRFLEKTLLARECSRVKWATQGVRVLRSVTRPTQRSFRNWPVGRCWTCDKSSADQVVCVPLAPAGQIKMREQDWRAASSQTRLLQIMYRKSK